MQNFSRANLILRGRDSFRISADHLTIISCFFLPDTIPFVLSGSCSAANFQASPCIYTHRIIHHIINTRHSNIERLLYRTCTWVSCAALVLPECIPTHVWINIIIICLYCLYPLMLVFEIFDIILLILVFLHICDRQVLPVAAPPWILLHLTI